MVTDSVAGFGRPESVPFKLFSYSYGLELRVFTWLKPGENEIRTWIPLVKVPQLTTFVSPTLVGLSFIHRSFIRRSFIHLSLLNSTLSHLTLSYPHVHPST